MAVELKAGRFKPEYAGKMNFYLNLLDDFAREDGENPSIGIILCSEKDYFKVEYALRGLDKPVGVSEYLLTRDLPPELQNKLPDPRQLEDGRDAGFPWKFEIGSWTSFSSGRRVANCR